VRHREPTAELKSTNASEGGITLGTENLHELNALDENHKQIVLTADRKPHEIPDIADRLRTHFAWGLLADIEPPLHQDERGRCR
jgi:chromosomal replication initiation ATPase DnaA